MATDTSPMPDDEGEDTTPSDDPDDDAEYSMAGKAIRHALHDNDDAGLAEAICHLIDLHTGSGDEEESEPESGPGKKPDLAILLSRKPKGSS